MEYTQIFEKNSSAYPALKYLQVQSDLPSNYKTDTDDAHYDWYLPIMPNYRYHIDVKGSFAIYDDETNQQFLSTGHKDSIMQVAINGKYGTTSAALNSFTERSYLTVQKILFYNEDYNYPVTDDTTYSKAGSSNDKGVKFMIYCTDDKPHLIRFNCFGNGYVSSSVTQNAFQSLTGYIHVNQIDTVYDPNDGWVPIIKRYGGFHDKMELMKYLNAYWDTMELFQNSLTWDEDNFAKVYVEVDYFN